MTNMVDTVRLLSFRIENRKKRLNYEETVNNDAREDELNSTHQGLSNNNTGHDFK